MSALVPTSRRGARHRRVTVLNSLLGCWLFVLAFQFTTVGNYHVLERFVMLVHLHFRYALEGLLTGYELAENGMLCIYMRTWCQSYEESVRRD